ncbi:NAD-dependent epimerase/dehydratase family protein [bacterium]|nr:NAD-dependent epimerase/dehydratase family protein [bacterium]
MRTVLVTGGAGFVGSNLTRRLTQQYGCQVTVLDDLFTGQREFLAGLDVELVEGSVTDTALVERLARGKTWIFHLAARNIIVSGREPRQDLEVNVIGTFNVLEAARKHEVERVIYSSTSSIYGNPRYIPILEDELPKFLSFYSSSKYAGESYCSTFHELYGVQTTILRYSNVYGPNQSPANPYCGVIGKFMAAALSGEPLRIHGDGEQTRDYTYVDDACEATIQAAIRPKAIGEIYNVGTELETSVNALARLVLEVSGGSSEIVYVDKRDIDNIRRRCLNIGKIRTHMRFTPGFTLARGLRQTFESLR